MKLPDWTLEPMTQGDLEAVLAIERASFSNPWPAMAFLPPREAYWARALVLRDRHRPEEVRGYICFWMLQGEMEIQNVAVRGQDRRTGGGRHMLLAALEEGRRQHCRSAWLEVRTSNRAAIELYEQLGFREVGLRRHYYDDGEDALIMRATLQSQTHMTGAAPSRRSLKGRGSGC